MSTNRENVRIGPLRFDWWQGEVHISREFENGDGEIVAMIESLSNEEWDRFIEAAYMGYCYTRKDQRDMSFDD